MSDSPNILLVSTDRPEMERLENGRGLLIRECFACLRIYWPGEYPPGAWNSIVRAWTCGVMGFDGTLHGHDRC